jgi:hypothetical protein
MATRQEVHRLVDAVPDDRLRTLGEIVRLAAESDMTWEQVQQLAELLRGDPAPISASAEPVRRFASTGTLTAEPDLAERAEEILRSEPGTAA